ncbi:hypothetical protein SAFG77S_00199 [Streptomyces afghaniensis]
MSAPRLSSTPLPGIGVRFDLTTRDSRHLSVVAHRDGHRTISAYRNDDPDACDLSVRLTAEEAATLIDALMPAHHTPNLLSTTDLGLVAERIELSGTSHWNSRLPGQVPDLAPIPARPSWRCCAGPRRSPPPRRTSGSPAVTRSS